MPSSASASPAAISLYDARPFFEKALQFGVANGLIDRAKLDAIGTDAPKGMVQIARYFGNEFLRPDIEKAKDRLVNLVSLHLESASGGDLRRAAELLRDHSFLSRSKAGSDMLRALLALPDSTSFDAHHDELNGIDSKSPPKGLAEWTLKRLADYQAELARRLPFQQEKEAALWLAAQLDLDADELEAAHTHAEAVIRTALLVRATRRTEWPDWVDFAKMITALRKKYRAAKSRTDAPAPTFSVALPADLPEDFRAVVQAVQGSLAADVLLMVNSPLSVRALFANDSEDHHPPLLGRYFWLEDMASEMAHHDRAISQAWDKVTGGNCDDGSLLTLLVCVAAGAAPKIMLTEKAAAALVRKIQKAGVGQGFDPELAHQYLLDHAPEQYQEGYVQLWADFVEEAQATLQSDALYSQNDALALLRRECHVI